jgi:hypothetical protein
VQRVPAPRRRTGTERIGRAGGSWRGSGGAVWLWRFGRGGRGGHDRYRFLREPG